MNPIQDPQTNLWYYTELPPGSVKATLDDFKRKIIKFAPDTPFCVKSFNTGIYECYRVGFTVSSNLIPFIEAGHVFFIPRKTQ